MAKCFKCEKEIGPAIQCPNVVDVGKETWDAPCGAVCFQGGSNFGSSLYDSFIDGIAVEIIVCDECLEQAKNTDKLREKNVSRRFM